MQLWELCLAGKNLYCKLGFVKLQIRVLNYKVTGCARLTGIHLGDHRVDVSGLQIIWYPFRQSQVTVATPFSWL